MSDTKRVVCVPEVLLPAKCDMHKWAVVACDQFTSQRSYWEDLDALVGDAPSTLRMILPECYLHDDAEARQSSVTAAMRRYYDDGLFYAVTSYISVTRTFASGRVRRGLVAAIDLERYDYRKGTHAAVRATEDTVASRLPARVKIRDNSLLELPHIMLFIDDPKNILFSAVKAAEERTLYDFELNGGGGHIVGKAVKDAATIDNAFDMLAAQTTERFGEELLLLVGDGNHSLAAAKNCYEAAKAAGSARAKRLRYALCEIVNLYDDGVAFEPIHRAVFGVDPAAFSSELAARTAAFPCAATLRGGGREYAYRLPDDAIAAVAFVQNFVEDYTAQHGGTVDYIHGDEVLRKLGERQDCAAIALPQVPKNGFTEYICTNGILPKKTFSIGHAEEKRYYLEARLLG